MRRNSPPATPIRWRWAFCCGCAAPAGWKSYESEPTLAFVPEVAPLLDALEEILNPRVVTYTGKLYKAWQLLQGVGEEKNPYENVLREVASDLEALNKSLRALNASIGHYIDHPQPHPAGGAGAV